MGDRVREHFRLFNDAVRRGDWTEFLTTFAPDAVMRFENIPAGPYAGLDAITAAYHANPPDDTMRCVSDNRDGDTDVVRFAWDAGGGGLMRVTWRDKAVLSVTVTFDELYRRVSPARVRRCPEQRDAFPDCFDGLVRVRVTRGLAVMVTEQSACCAGRPGRAAARRRYGHSPINQADRGALGFPLLNITG
jgi:hypothetical protein